jgi:hypothetical protein
VAEIIDLVQEGTISGTVGKAELAVSEKSWILKFVYSGGGCVGEKEFPVRVECESGGQLKPLRLSPS